MAASSSPTIPRRSARRSRPRRRWWRPSIDVRPQPTSQPSRRRTSLTSQEMETGFVECTSRSRQLLRRPSRSRRTTTTRGSTKQPDGLLRQLIPLVLIPLVILMAIQLPIATSMARRVRRHDSERSELAERSLAVSERERIRIAADLHDSPIQDLAGMGYRSALSAMSVPDRHHDLMQKLQTTVQRSVESLRQLMVEISIPRTSPGGRLPESLANLAAPLQEKGIAVDLVVGSIPELSPEILTTLYRVANEALANTADIPPHRPSRSPSGRSARRCPAANPASRQSGCRSPTTERVSISLRRMDRRWRGISVSGRRPRASRACEGR